MFSNLGEGTTFQIYLPASEQKYQQDCFDTGGIIKGSGKILVMDDEKSIRETARQMLCSLGYEVELARNGLDAITKYKHALIQGDRFNVVIMDLTIPGGMGGKEAINILRKIDSKAKVIVNSGYSNDPIIANYQECGFDAFVCKPYNLIELSQVVYRVINYS